MVFKQTVETMRIKPSLRFILILTIIALATIACYSTPSVVAPKSNTNTVTTTKPRTPSSTNAITLVPSPTDTLSPATPTSTYFPNPTIQLSTETASPQPSSSSNSIQVHFFDVGQGDSTLIESPDGKTMLIDGGEPDTGVVQYLQGLNIRQIDVMVATHPHQDHIGGLVQVLNALPVKPMGSSPKPSTLG